MATDFVKLFDERLCREILIQDPGGFVEFVCGKWARLPQDSFLRWRSEGEVVKAHVQGLLESEFTIATLKRQLVDELCALGGATIRRL